MQQEIYNVSEINLRIKQLMDDDFILSNICIRGELSNYKIYPSGHHYFTMKDEGGSLRCVMFKGSAQKLRFRPENGMKVLASGRITVFPRDGQYQLYCNSISPDGLGSLHLAFEQLKQKLEKEGLFDPQYKKPLPKYPHRIAIITSPAGAAIRDMLRILGKRYPLAKVILLPVRVQGEEAPAEICGALRYANRFQLADVIITGRGGGSIEDLWAFNDEGVARAIFQSDIPVVSAVGHEPDVTISDYVADLRAATPSNAAELVAPDISELRIRLCEYENRCAQITMQMLRQGKQRLSLLAGSRVMQSPVNYIQDKRMVLDSRHHKLSAVAQNLLAIKKQEYVKLASFLDALSPLKVLGRGYSIVKNEAGGVVKSYEEAEIGDRIQIKLQDGALRCTVNERIAENE